MRTPEELYAELKPDIEAVAAPLFEFSRTCLRKRGSFLPHAAVLTEEGEVELVGALPEGGSDLTNSTEVLPVLHEGLRCQSRETHLKAIGVAEHVTITTKDERPTQAIKVLLEHRRGLAVALYLPFRKRIWGFAFGKSFSVAATPEVGAWSNRR